MSLKELFKNIDTKMVASGTLQKIIDETESVNFVESFLEQQNKFRTEIDFSIPDNFAKFGSAEKYYVDAAERIYKTYPYDGSRHERIQYELSSSDLDKYLFENEYPRTNGYANFIVSPGTTGADGNNWFPSSGDNEYILVKGGPNTSRRKKGKDIQDVSGDYKDGYANTFDLSKNRENNLKIDGTDGNTIEFWLKKESYIDPAAADQQYFEYIFDAHVPGTVRNDAPYGRLTVALATTGTQGNTDDQPIMVTFASGSSNITTYIGSNTLTTSSIADGKWHHYAIRLKTIGTDTAADLFVDGEHNDAALTTGTSIGYVSGAIVATIGSQVAAFNAGGTDRGARGWSKFSGSLDEIRYWKTWRTSEQIGRQYIEPIGAGTNTDEANTDLGAYYKFNEGITQTSSVDSTVLDYSGRISNGSWVGYNSTSSRSTGSAFVLSGKVASEFKDPILYNFHPDVVKYINDKTAIGQEYDYRNPNSIYKSVPSWITELDNTKTSPPLKNLTQIISSYFDTLHNQIENLSTLKHVSYVSGTASGSNKPYFFNNRILQSHGFPYIPDLFKDATFLEYFRNRDDRKLFEEKLYNVKNTIYSNIYNNLSYINKTKGTEKAFRNMMRCFGLDDEVLKIRYYANNSEHEFKDNYKSITETKNYADFSLTGSSEATIYQYQTDSNTTSYISASDDATSGIETTGLGFTVECQAIFPIVKTAAEASTIVTSKDLSVSKMTNNFVLDKQTSIYGVRSVKSPLEENDMTVDSDDRPGFVVKAIRDDEYSKRSYFKLEPTTNSYLPTITSSYFEDVFDDTKWNLAVTVRPTKYGQAEFVSGTNPDESDAYYDVVFQGVNTVLGETRDSFDLSSRISETYGKTILSHPKRVFVGAQRENLSGSVVTRANSSITDCRFWLVPLSFHDLKKHNADFKNFGVSNPYQSAYLFQTDVRDIRVSNIETLALHWNFSNLTSSDANGQFTVADFSSGSSTDDRFGNLSNILSRQHAGRGDHFIASFAKSFAKKNIYNSKSDLPEYVTSYDMIRTDRQDDLKFTRETRPTSYFMTIEKSMYQTVSEEMLKMFGSMVDFGSLVGRQVDKYRVENKELVTLRRLFFENVANTPQLEKYIDYYKWFDTGLNVLLSNLIPATALTHDSDNIIKPVVEEYVFNREKYLSKFPTLELKASDPEGNILAINELLYNWEFGGGPLTTITGLGDETDHCLWWKERAERGNPLITSGDSNLDSDKQTILDVINNLNNASAPYLSGSGGSYQGSTYAIRKFARPYKFTVNKEKKIHGGANSYENKKIGFWDAINNFGAGSEEAIIQVNDDDIEAFNCNDDLALNNGKRKYSFTAKSRVGGGDFVHHTDLFKGDLVLPFNLYSSSVGGAYRDLIDAGFKEGVDITNLHLDSYGPFNDIPMQGPFTEKFVGGRTYRHIFSNISNQDSLDDKTTRAEGWKLSLGSSKMQLLNPDSDNVNSVRSQYFRPERAKRPVNIRNIQMFTGSDSDGWHGGSGRPDQARGVTNIGNYKNTHEFIMINGRSINNKYFVESGGDLPTTYNNSTFVSGVNDFAIPRRDLTGSNKYIIVNRFSAPGDPATMGEGMLDIAAAEHSVYNALPFRNLSVREPLKYLLSDHANQFGYFSDAFVTASYSNAMGGILYPGGNSEVNPEDYSGTASFHKVNRNGRLKIAYGVDGALYMTGVAYDNFFVQHQIPQTDAQYAWITSSLVEDYSGSVLFGFEQKDFSNSSYASSDILTIEESEIQNSIGIKVDFVGLNTLVVEIIDSSSNTLGSSADDGGNVNGPGGTVDSTDMLNAINLHRNGPYQWPSWQHTRGAEHPIIRHARNNNRLNFSTNDITIDTKKGTQIFVKSPKGDIEPPINSRHMPIDYSVVINNSENKKPENFNFMQTFYNGLVNFSDKVQNGVDLNGGPYFRNDEIEGYPVKVLPYNTIKNLIVGDLAGDPTNPIASVNGIWTKEIIFPREKYTYMSTHRQRENYQNDFWRDARLARYQRRTGDNLVRFPFVDLADASADPGDVYADKYGMGLTTSLWPLDARYDFETASPGRIKSGSNEGSVDGGAFTVPISGSSDAAGILQNGLLPYSIYIQFAASRNAVGANLAPQYNRRIAGAITADPIHEYKFGDTKWEADVQSGKTPFYDTYGAYSEDLKAAGKDFSIIPEFIISDHMEYYLNEGDEPGNFLIKNPGMFSLTGATIADTGEADFAVTYSHSDFLKTFNIVRGDYGDKYDNTRITLECEGLIKFLPYDGFYPADRTVQLTKLFWDSHSASFAVQGDVVDFGGGTIGIQEDLRPREGGYLNPIWKTLFAPGVLYNSIKSGIAVDYPAHTSASGPLLYSGSTNQRITINGESYLKNIPRIASPFDYRVPFESLVDPESLQGNQFIDNEPHPSASLALTASINGMDKLNYKFAMHNFLAATVDFFKPRGELLTLASDSDAGGKFEGKFQQGLSYEMKIVCGNSKFKTLEILQNAMLDDGDLAKSASYNLNPPDIIMYAQTGSDNVPHADYYGSAFGPPVHNSSSLCYPAFREDPTWVARDPLYGSASFEPFTPPYYDGYSHIRLEFRPEWAGDGATVPQLLNRLTASFYRTATGISQEPQQQEAMSHRDGMQLSASLNYLQLATNLEPILDAKGKIIGYNNDEGSKGNRLVIQPKWETPILDFQSADVALPAIGSGSVARGMWHQYGAVPKAQKAVFLEVQDLTDWDIQTNLGEADYGSGGTPALTASLRKALNIPAGQYQLGTIAEEKTIREAIIAIPHQVSNMIDEEGSAGVFPIVPQVIDQAIDFLDNGGTAAYKQLIEADPTMEPSKEIIDMVKKMRKYVFPPTYDFLTNKTVTPFAMFIFEFETSLSKKDLAKIWQNLSPDIGTKIKKAKAALPVELLSTALPHWKQKTHLFNEVPIGIQWKVFKVKEKGAWNYWNKTAQIEQLDPSEDFVNLMGEQKGSIPDYSYNWPYDFFSLVELGKIKMKARFALAPEKPDEEEEPTVDPPEEGDPPVIPPTL